MTNNAKLFWALIVLATLLLILLIVSQVAGCTDGVEPPVVESWQAAVVGDPAPAHFEGDLVVEWYDFAVVIDYDQRLTAPFTSGVCVDMLSRERVLIYRACGQCAWGEDGTVMETCRLVRQPVIGDDE